MQISALGHAEVGVRPNIVSGLIGVHLRSGWSWTGKTKGMLHLFPELNTFSTGFTISLMRRFSASN